MKFNRYLQPTSVAEALALAGQPGTVILGGMMWLRMQKRTVETVLDLSLLGLDKIEETPEGIRIGAYVTLRELETSPLLLDYTGGVIASVLKPIVGVQFRNSATVGGSVYGRFGFSDVSTLFTALGASVVLAGQGTVPMDAFMRDGAPRDLITHILLPKNKPDGFAAQAHRNSATDFPIVTVAACRRGDVVRVTLTPAPVRGQTGDYRLGDDVVNAFVSGVTFRSSTTASSAYREHLARVLIARCLTALGG